MKCQCSLLYSSGYQANLSLFSVFERNTLLLYDEYIHASIRDGIRLSTARAYSFSHNNIASLDHLLQKYHPLYDQVIVITESLFSMHGDYAQLESINALISQPIYSNAYLIVDEAHTFGYTDLNLPKSHKLLARLITFSKSIGMDGAAWLFYDHHILDVIVNTSRPFIYTTAPSIDFLNTIKQRLTYFLIESRVEREQLWENIDFYLSIIESTHFSKHRGPIQYYSNDLNTLTLICEKLLDYGIKIKIVQYPTVPLGQERIRFCLRADHSKGDILHFIQTLELVANGL